MCWVVLMASTCRPRSASKMAFIFSVSFRILSVLCFCVATNCWVHSTLTWNHEGQEWPLKRAALLLVFSADAHTAHCGKNPHFIQKSHFRNSQFSQNSPFQNHIFDKIHIFKITFFTKFTFLKYHIWQNSHFRKFTFFNYQILGIFWVKSRFMSQCVHRVVLLKSLHSKRLRMCILCKTTPWPSKRTATTKWD